MILVQMTSKYKNFIDICGTRLLKKEEAKALENFFLTFEQTEVKLYDEENVVIRKNDIVLTYVDANVYNNLVDLNFRNFGYSHLIYELIYISQKYSKDMEKNEALNEDLKVKNIY